MFDQVTSDTILDTPFYTEGPVIDAQGNVFVTNILGGQILKVNTNFELEEWARCTSPNGQWIAENGDHFVCNSLEGSIERFDAFGVHVKTWFKGNINDISITCPNDLWIDRNGAMFFTDSVRHTGSVVYVDEFGEGKIIADRLDYPNGIVYVKEEDCLFVAESYQNRILRIELRGKEPRISVLVDLPSHSSGNESLNLPDGLALDGNGNLWIAHYGMGSVHRYNLKQKILFSHESQISLTSNVFVSPDKIVITGGTGEPGPGKIRIIER